MLNDAENAEFVRMGKPRTTLERLFLDEAKKSESPTPVENSPKEEANNQKGADHA